MVAGLRFFSLLALAQGVRLRLRKSVNLSSVRGGDDRSATEDIALKLNRTAQVLCWCKNLGKLNVDDAEVVEKKCPDNKYTQEGKVNGPRWFHPDPALCCKLQDPSERIGWSYSQANIDNCRQEERPVKRESCCLVDRVKGGGYGRGRQQAKPIGIRVKKIMKFSGERLRYATQKPDPFVQQGDIYGSVDHEGEHVSIEETWEALELRGLLKTGRSPGNIGRLPKDVNVTRGPLVACLQLLDNVPDDQCRIAHDSPAECCCREDTLASRTTCLWSEGAPTASEISEAQSKIWRAKVDKYSSSKGGDFRSPILEATVREPDGPRDSGLQRDQKAPDPRYKRVWNWKLSATQWKRSCYEWDNIPEIEEYEERHEEPAETVIDPATYYAHVVKPARTVITKKYRQAYKRSCVGFTFSRLCPPGHGSYEKLIPYGTCMTPENGLVRESRLVFACPAGSRSSKGLIDSCRCAEQCKG